MVISQLSTAKEVSTEIVEAFGDTSDASFNKAYNCINRALGLITRRGSWPFFRAEDMLVVTAANQQFYKLRPRVKQPRYVHMRDPAIKLKFFDLRDLRVAFPNNTVTTGAPFYWNVKTFNAGSAAWELGLWPIPDGVYNLYIDADQNPELITNANDVIANTGLPPEMTETLIALATALMYEKSADADYAGKMQQAMAMLEEDYYRMGITEDDNLNAREHSGYGDIYMGGPIFDPRFSTVY